MTESLKSKLANRKPAVGSWISLASEETCEIMARAGFEWLAIDMEHTAIGTAEMARLIRVIDLCGVTPIVRVGANNPLLIKHALDAGAKGIIAPMVTSPVDAEAAVAAAHYPPNGTRGVGLHRAQGYGRDFAAYQDWMRDGPVVVAQVEHRDGVDQLDAIMATPGLDAFFIGPYDLSASFGKPGAFDDPDVTAALRRVDGALRNGPIAGGIHVVEPNAEDLKRQLDAGHCFVAFGVDMIFMANAADTAASEIAKALT